MIINRECRLQLPLATQNEKKCCWHFWCIAKLTIFCASRSTASKTAAAKTARARGASYLSLIDD
jgi:hypothetical protein